MARPTPTVSFGSGFNAARFRDVIRNTMVMGLPNATLEKPTFRWTTKHTYNPQDPAHDPYDWTETPTSTITKADVQVPCAVEFSARPTASLETPLGEFDATRVIVTALDVDYDLIKGADQVLLGGNTYDIDFVAPPYGLFEVTVYQLYAVARDES